MSFLNGRTSALRHVTRELGVHVIWSPQISRLQTWMAHRRQEDRRGRSADHPERSRRDRSAHHPEWRSLGSQQHVQPRLSVQKRPEGEADDERFRAQPTDSHATVVAHFPPFDPRILTAIFVVRNKEGFRVARDAKGQFRGMFLREQSAVSFARGHSRPVERTMASPSRTIQLDLKSKGNPLPVNCISVRFHQESWRPNRNIRNAVVRGLTRFLIH
jgi:hypothetical protein